MPRHPRQWETYTIPDIPAPTPLALPIPPRPSFTHVHSSFAVIASTAIPVDSRREDGRAQAVEAFDSLRSRGRAEPRHCILMEWWMTLIEKWEMQNGGDTEILNNQNTEAQVAVQCLGVAVCTRHRESGLNSPTRNNPGAMSTCGTTICMETDAGE